MPIPIAAIGGLLLSGAFILQGFIPPVQRETTYILNKLLPNALPAVREAIDLRHRGLIGEKAYMEYLRSAGFNEIRANRYWEASHAILSADALLTLLWRQEITKEQYNERMQQLGYKEEEAADFDKARQFYPSPTDLVMWQAKEVFEPDAVKKYGLDNEFELINKEAFYKAGMSDEQIKNYWRAHWQHPSLNMVYELFHRGLLNKQDVYEYYRLVEIPPYWREKLTAVSHPPYTRVDTRRMYEMGVLTEEQVLRNYMDLGYDEEKAANMTEFTVKYSTQKDRDLTRTQIEKAYEYGIITPEVAIDYLKGLGYDDKESLFILSLKSYALMEDELDDKVSTIKTQFRRGLITEAQALSGLDKLEISPVFRDKTIAEILRVKQTEFQLPSKADIANWFIAGIIDEPQFISYMDRLGFQESEILLYLESFKV